MLAATAAYWTDLPSAAPVSRLSGMPVIRLSGLPLRRLSR